MVRNYFGLFLTLTIATESSPSQNHERKITVQLPRGRMEFSVKQGKEPVGNVMPTLARMLEGFGVFERMEEELKRFGGLSQSEPEEENLDL